MKKRNAIIIKNLIVGGKKLFSVLLLQSKHIILKLNTNIRLSFTGDENERSTF
jgi:hypothetical protein